MDVNSLSSIFETQGLLPARTESRKKASTASKDEGDTVSISDEAKAMLARMTASMKEKDSSTSTDASADSQDSASGEQGGSSASGGAAGGGSGIGQDSAEQIENIEEQINKLQSQYQSVMKGPGDESVKEAQGAGIQQAISALEQQLNELKMSTQKKA